MSIINLLPEDYVKRRQHMRANMLCAGLFVVVMTGVLTAAVMTERSTRHTRQVAAQVNASYAEASRLIEQLNRLQSQKQQMLRKAERTADLLERVPRSSILAVVAGALPKKASLKTFKLYPIHRVVKAPAPPKPAGEGEEKTKYNQVVQARNTTKVMVGMDMIGLAATDVEVATFIARLAKSPMSRSVDLAYSQEKTRKDEMTVREFKVTVTLKPGIDVINFLDELMPAEREIDTSQWATQGA